MQAMERMIRERAYQLWESAGRPDGRSEEFWLAAKAEFEPKEATRERRLAYPKRRASTGSAYPFAGLRMFVVKRPRIGGRDRATRAFVSVRPRELLCAPAVPRAARGRAPPATAG